MAKMKKFMVVHKEPRMDCNAVQGNWRKMAQVETATWIRTYINEKKGLRYCIWHSPGEDELKKIFDKMGVGYEGIIEVEETVPDLWGPAWQEHLEKDATADTLGH